MKRLTEVVLMLCIAMMCTTSFEAQGQNRHRGGESSRSPRTEHRAPSGHSGPSTKMSSPRSNNYGSQVNRGRAPQANRSQAPQMNRNRSGNVSRNQAPQMNRNHSGNVNRGQAPQMNRNHSGNVARNNRPADRPNVNRSPRNDGPRPGSGRGDISRSSRSGPNHSARIARNDGPRPAPSVRSPRPGSGRGPTVAHAPRPSRRGPAYSRPYLEPRYRPMPSYHYGNHYFGHRIHTLPYGYSLIRVGYRDYYYYDGIYYRPYWDGGYYVCRPPLGTRIATALFDIAMSAIAINTIRNEIERAQTAAELSRIYAAQNANYVLRSSDDYYNSNLLGQSGQNYYYQDGVFYTLVNGEYCVIEAPIGALVDEIPEDYDEIVLGGQTYYQVEDTLYKPTIIDGKLHFEVVCNL